MKSFNYILLRLLDTSLYEMKILNIQDEETVAYAKWIPITAFIQKEKYYIQMEF